MCYRHLAALLLLALPACQVPVGVKRTGFQPIYTELRRNVLDEDSRPSPAAQMMLAYVGKADRYRDEPAQVIEEMEDIARAENLRRIHSVLAELHYDLALARGDRRRFLASAIHAYTYLFGEGFDKPPNPFSRNYRLACDLYNRGLARALLDPAGHVMMSDGVFDIPGGRIAIQVTRPGFPWSAEVFPTFLPADAFVVRGLRERVREQGLGVPLIAVISERAARELAAEGHVGMGGIKLAATAFLRLHGGLDELRAGTLTASLELYLASDVPTVTVGDVQVPLETDITAALAHALEESKIWKFQLAGFLRGSTKDFETGVFMLQPYQPGKVPLVLVHGTFSSPAAWAQTINSLAADHKLRAHYQIWLAMYNTGNPIVYTAALQREALVNLVRDLDPEGRDPALQRTVLVGYSQGGLVSRLLVTHSGDGLWRKIVDVPFDEYEMTPEHRELFRSSLYFEPLPFVERVVFIATPHRGSFFSTSWIGRLGGRLVKLPSTLTDAVSEVFEGSDLPEDMRKLRTSVDNMDPEQPFVQALAELQMADGLKIHTIAAVKPHFRDVAEGNDGVVAYTSAHLEEAASEVVVRSNHYCLDKPETIGELRRILLEHLDAGPPVSVEGE